MATQAVAVTGTPVDISASVPAGDRYTLQNVAPDARVILREAATEPDPTAGGFILEPLAWGTLRPEAGVPVWVWSPEGAARLVIGEAA